MNEITEKKEATWLRKTLECAIAAVLFFLLFLLAETVYFPMLIIQIPVIWVCFFLYLDEMIKIPVVYRYFKKYRWVKNIVNKE